MIRSPMAKLLSVITVLFMMSRPVEAAKLSLQVGHSGEIMQVKLSRDGTFLASAGIEGSAKLWEVSSGRILYNFTHKGSIHSLSFSPDNKILSTAGIDGKIKFWDLSTGSCVREMEGTTWWDGRHGPSVYFSEDWKYIGMIRFKERSSWPVYCTTTSEIIELESGKKVCAYDTEGRAQTIAIAFSDDNGLVSFCTRGYGKVPVWELPSGKPVAEFSSWLYSLEFSHNGKYLIGGDRSGLLHIWDSKTGKEVKGLKHKPGYGPWVSWAKFTSDDKFIVAANYDSTISIWDVEKSKEAKVMDAGKLWPHGGCVRYADISSDGKIIAGAIGKAIGIWEFETGKLLKVLKDVPAATLTVIFSKDGKYLAFAGIDGVINLWDLREAGFLCTKANDMPINSLCLSQDNNILASASDDSTIKLYEMPELKLISALKGHKHHVMDSAFSPDDKYLASGGWGEEVKVWEVKTLKELKRLPVPRGIHPNVIYNLKFSPDGKYLAASLKHSSVRIWKMPEAMLYTDIKAWTPEGTEEDRFDGFVHGLDFSKSSVLATGQWGGQVMLWDLDTEICVGEFTGHRVTCLEFSPDGGLASGGADNIIMLNLNTGRKATLTGHSDTITDICFSSDGKLLASSSFDGTVKIWDIKQGKFILTIFSPKEGSIIAYTPENYYYCSKGAEKYLLFTEKTESYTLDEYKDRFKWENKQEEVKIK